MHQVLERCTRLWIHLTSKVYYYNCLQRDRELSVPFRMPGFRFLIEGAEIILSYGKSEYPGEVGYDEAGAEQTGNDDGLGVFSL